MLSPPLVHVLQIKEEMRTDQLAEFRNEATARKKVLRALNHINDEGGRVCHMMCTATGEDMEETSDVLY
jgi:hypothetical protein